MSGFPGIRIDGGALELDLKVVPGARRDEISGPLGERLKVRTTAPPEGGKANRAVVGLLARTLGLPARAITIQRGHSAAEKTVRIEGLDLASASGHLGLTTAGSG